jgi:MFS family permease
VSQHPLSLLKERIFARFWGAGVISNVGSFMQSSVLAVLIAEQTRKASLSGLIMVTTFLPQVVAGPLGGILADRYDRRRTSFLTMAGTTVATAILAVLVISGTPPIPILVGLLFAQGFCVSMGDPSNMAITAGLVGPERMTQASPLMAMSWNSGRVLGPPIGLFLAQVTNTFTVILLNAVTFALVALNLWLLRARSFQPPSREAKPVVAEMREAIHVMWNHPTCGFVVRHSFIFQSLLVPFMGVIPIWTLRKFGSATLAGAFFLAQGLGSIAGSMVVTNLSHRFRRERTVLGISAGSSISLLLYVVAPAPWVGIVMVFLLGAFVTMIFTSLMGVLHRDAPEDLRGRISALMMATLGISYTIGVLVVGAVGDSWSLGPVLAICSVAFLAFMGLSRALDGDAWRVLDHPTAPLARARGPELALGQAAGVERRHGHGSIDSR